MILNKPALWLSIAVIKQQLTIGVSSGMQRLRMVNISDNPGLRMVDHGSWLLIAVIRQHNGEE